MHEIHHKACTHNTCFFFLVKLSISWCTEYPGQFRNLIVSLLVLPVQLGCTIQSFPKMFHFPVSCLLIHKCLKKLLPSLAFIDSNLFHRSRWTSKILTVTWALWQICIRIRTSTRALRTKPCWRTSNKLCRASKCSSLSHCHVFLRACIKQALIHKKKANGNKEEKKKTCKKVWISIMFFAAVINCIIFHYLWFCYAFEGGGGNTWIICCLALTMITNGKCFEDHSCFVNFSYDLT